MLCDFILIDRVVVDYLCYHQHFSGLIPSFVFLFCILMEGREEVILNGNESCGCYAGIIIIQGLNTFT